MKRKNTVRKACLILASIIFATVSCSFRVEKPVDRQDAAEDLVWHNAAHLGVIGKGWNETESDYDRLPLKAKRVVRGPVWRLSRSTAGLQVRFATDARTLHVRWTLTKSDLARTNMPASGVSGIDLYARDPTGRLRFCGNAAPEGRVNEATFSLPASREYVLYLPLYNGIERLEIGLDPDKTLIRLPPPDQYIVFYGTSITQGACASRPGMAATAIVGRALDTMIVNLGFSGNGRMEIELADLLSELAPIVLVLDCLWNMSAQSVAERVAPFVKRIRATRPTTPILLVEDSNVQDQPTKKGDALRAIYAKLKAQGDPNLYFLANKGMLGNDGEGTVDGGHHNDLGMARQAQVFIRSLEAILKQKTGAKPDSGDVR